MDTDKERNQAFRAELFRIRKQYSALHKDAVDQMASIALAALSQIREILKGAPTDYQSWILPQLESQVKAVLDNLRLQGQATSQQQLVAAWANGIAMIDSPLQAAGVFITLPMVDQRQLNAITHLAAGRIAGITDAVRDKIITQLGLVVLGAQPFADAVTVVSELMDHEVRWQGLRVLRSEIGRANDIASQLRKIQAADYLPGLKKQWRRSRRKDPREHHAAADGQVRELEEPFNIGGIEMMHPHDPNAPAKEVVNCGCMSLPYMDSWVVRYPNQRNPAN